MVRGDIWRAGDGLAFLWGSERISLHLSIREQAHLQLHSHLPCSCHLSHELSGHTGYWHYVCNSSMPTREREVFVCLSICTGTSIPIRAASSHSQQAIAVSIPCSVNILSGDQHRWCRSWGSQSTGNSGEKMPPHPPKKERDMNLIPTSSLIIPKYQSKS